MDKDSFYNLVEELRKTQREFFATRTYAVLKKSKVLERKVDEAIAAYRREKASDGYIQDYFDFFPNK